MDPSTVRVETEAESLARMEIEEDKFLSHSSSLPMDPSAVRVETEAERLSRREIEADAYLARVNRPYVKSFTNRDGDIIDCVRFEDRLGFDPIRDAHILKIVMSQPERTQRFKMGVWDEFGCREGKMIPMSPDEDCCPKGTVPIKRIHKEDVLKFDPIESYGTKTLFTKHPSYLSSMLRHIAEAKPFIPSEPVKPGKSES